MSDVYGATPATSVTPDSLAVRRKMALLLMQQGADTSPVKAWSQGAARIAQGLLGAYSLSSADKEQNAARDASINDFTTALAPSGAPAAQSPIAPASDGSLPRGYRNNNPLNIEAGSFTQGQPGFAGSDGRFAKFASLGQGTNAANTLLDTYQNKYGLNTPAGIVGRWAPSSDGNNVPAYAGQIAKALGIGPNDTVPPEMRSKLIAAMAQHENGMPMPASTQPPQEAPQQVAQAAPQQPTINPAMIRALSNQFLPPALGQLGGSIAQRQTSPPSFGAIGSDQYGNPIHGWINPNSQTTTPAGIVAGKQVGPGGQITTTDISGAPPTTGEDFLKTLDPAKAALVKSIAEGRAPYPQGFLLKTPYGQWLQQAITQYDPQADATVIGQRRTFNTQLGSSNPTSVGGQKLVMGTALGHLSEIADAATGLDNSSGPLPSGVPFSADLAHGINSIANRSVDKSAKVNALNDAVQKFSGEVGKLYSGSSGGGINERESTRARFSGNLSNQEMAASLEMSKQLIGSKLDALENQRDQIFGPNGKKNIEFLGPKDKAAMAKIDSAIARLRGQQAEGGQQNTPQTKPETTKTINGKNYIQQNGQWFEQ